MTIEKRYIIIVSKFDKEVFMKNIFNLLYYGNISVFDDKEISATFELPENIKPVALLPIGYPADDAAPNEKLHNSFRPQEETVTFL